MAVIAAARNAGLDNATTFELDPKSKELVINTMEGQEGKEMTGGTMRLGDYNCHIEKGTLAFKVYRSSTTIERHRHRGECNSRYLDQFPKWGIKASGINPDNNLVEIIEGINHPFFLASQFHPEFKSRPTSPHPMFDGFIKATLGENN
jgi:CTP synthase